MKKRRVVLIVCLALSLMLAGFLIVRAVLINRQPDPPMEESDLLFYLAELQEDETEADAPADLLWAPVPDDTQQHANPIP